MAKDLGLDIDTRVSMDLHPQTVASLPDYDDDTEPELRQVVDAFQQAYDVIRKVHDARAAVEGDVDLTPAGRVLATSDVANKVMERATKAFDKAAANMRSGIENIEKQLTAPVQARAAHTISTEIRSYLRSSKSPMDAVRKAIAEGDHDTATAALGAPAYLSGLTPEMQQVLTRVYHETHQPTLAKRLRAMRAAADLLDNKAPLIFPGIEKAVGLYVDPKTGRKYHPRELRAMREKSAKTFAQLAQ
jgi:hypothetical protein